MAFNKRAKILFIMIFSWVIAHYIYNRYVKLGFDTIEINLNKLCKKEKLHTLFIFEFKNRRVLIKDKNSKVIKIYIHKDSLKDKFKLESINKKRLLHLGTGAILKTHVDSIDVMNESEKLHGYMGIYTRNDCYYIDINGTFNICK